MFNPVRYLVNLWHTRPHECFMLVLYFLIAMLLFGDMAFRLGLWLYEIWRLG